MKIDIITLFPEICRVPLSESMMKRAQQSQIVDLKVHNLRDWTTDKHHVVDGAPFGGGQGMVMKPEPIFAAVEDLEKENAQRPTFNAQHSTTEAEGDFDESGRETVRSANGGQSFQRIASHRYLRTLRRSGISASSSIWLILKSQSGITF